MAEHGEKSGNSGWYRFPLGNFSCTVVWDGFLIQPYEGIYPNAGLGELQALRDENGLRKDFIPMDLNVLVVDTGREILVVDSGMGEAIKIFGKDMGRMPANIRAAGFDPSQVDYVLMTHLHPDHAFGLIDADGRAVFPNATLCVTQSELDEWTDRSKLSLPDFRKDWVAGALPAIAAYEGRIRIVGEGDEIVPGVSVTMSTGHSSGHCTFLFESDGQKLLAIGDTAHHPVYDLAYTSWFYSMDYDSVPKDGARAKEKVFALAAQDDTFLHAYHFPFPGIGRVVRRAGAFAFLPIPYNPHSDWHPG